MAKLKRVLAVVAVAAIALALGCSSEPDVEEGFVVAAHDAYVDARVFVDGTQVGTLQHLQAHDGVFQRVVKKIYGDSPAFHFVAMRMDLTRTPLRHGEHTLRVEKSGRPVATGAFTYPFRGEPIPTFYVGGTKVEPVP